MPRGSVEFASSDRSADALDGAKTSVRQSVGKVFGLSLEVGDEGVQTQWIGGLGQDGLHERGGLVGEVVPVLDRESGGLDKRAQFVGGDQMAAGGLVGPRHGIVEFAAALTDCDVPHGK